MAGESDGPAGGASGGAETPAARPRPAPPRLPSIRAPRDLTLSAALRPALLHATKNKRVFVPNLDVKREKPDEKSRDNDRRGGRDRKKDDETHLSAILERSF
ncbi:uncharacterized protein LOC119104266 [Pollicipes pollicipes]|uniref:uncharacterized protein LOC119104266 n=1 Tax=Pollicipes pollicipes TaxID=41117 RepID=UPI0018859810|nr:uncharacterized protein LOC119104266 [Pollicipes pollicipes]